MAGLGRRFSHRLRAGRLSAAGTRCRWGTAAAAGSRRTLPDGHRDLWPVLLAGTSPATHPAGRSPVLGGYRQQRGVSTRRAAGLRPVGRWSARALTAAAPTRGHLVSFRTRFLKEIASLGLPAGPGGTNLVSESELAALPEPAERLMRFMNVPGRPRDWSFRLGFEGRFGAGRKNAGCDARGGSTTAASPSLASCTSASVRPDSYRSSGGIHT